MLRLRLLMLTFPSTVIIACFHILPPHPRSALYDPFQAHPITRWPALSNFLFFRSTNSDEWNTYLQSFLNQVFLLFVLLSPRRTHIQVFFILVFLSLRIRPHHALITFFSSVFFTYIPAVLVGYLFFFWIGGCCSYTHTRFLHFLWGRLICFDVFLLPCWFNPTLFTLFIFFALSSYLSHPLPSTLDCPLVCFSFIHLFFSAFCFLLACVSRLPNSAV